MTIITISGLSFFITIALMPVFVHLAVRYSAYDIPDWRKIHNQPVPHVGGIVMAIGTFVSVLLYSAPGNQIRAYLAGSLILALFGLADDFKGLDYRLKFTGQIVASMIAILYGGIKIIHLGSLLPGDMVIPEITSVIFTLLVIVGLTNAINMSDGLDGLAGGICLLSFLCICYLAYLEKDMNIVVIAAALAGSIYGFLLFNTYPASVFMGDTGSQVLGFSAAFLSLTLTQGHTSLSPLLPLVIFGFPILDSITVSCRRLFSGRSPFIADKDHFHHQFVRMGLFHSEAVFTIYVIQSMMIVLAYILRFQSEWVIVSICIAFSGLALTFFNAFDTRKLTIRRFDRINKIIRERAQVWRENGRFIWLSYKSIQFGAPLLLIWTVFLCDKVPGYLSLSSGAAVILFGAVWLINRKWSNQFLLILIYLSVPFLIYYSENHPASWTGNSIRFFYHLFFILLTAFSFLTLRLTRRQHGFKVNTRHYLVLFITLILFALPEPDLRDQFGAVAVKMIMLFYIYEILLGEMRGKIGLLSFMTLSGLAIVALRWFF